MDSARTPYFHIRDELRVQDGLVFSGNRLVILKTLRKQMLHELYLPIKESNPAPVEVGCGLFEFNNKEYIVAVEYFSYFNLLSKPIMGRNLRATHLLRSHQNYACTPVRTTSSLMAKQNQPSKFAKNRLVEYFDKGLNN